MLFSRYLRDYTEKKTFITTVIITYYTLIQKIYAKFLINTFRKEMFIFYHMPMEYYDKSLIFSCVIRRWMINIYIEQIITLVSAIRYSSINILCSFVIIRYLSNNRVLYF